MSAKCMFDEGKFFSALTRRDLIRLKSRALRCGAWFRVLGRVERALVDVAIRIVRRVRSAVLYKALISVVKKLENILDDRVSCAVRTVGFPCAQRLSLLAQKWGNKSAKEWMSDLSFARFLAIMHINNPALFRC